MKMFQGKVTNFEDRQIRCNVRITEVSEEKN